MIPSCKRIYLCRPDYSPICCLNGVQTDTVEYDAQVKDFDTLSFTVDEYIDVDGVQIKSNGYDDLKIAMYLYLEDIGMFQMEEPQIDNDGYKETKTITAYSTEKEFYDKTWVNFKVNTGEKNSLEQLADGNLNDLGYAKEFIKFYQPDKPQLSLLNLIINEKMPNWHIEDKDIDPLLWDVKLSIDESSINMYALLTSIIAPKAECIFMFDTINRKIKAISKHSLDYETNIFISFRNLAQELQITVDEDSVYT